MKLTIKVLWIVFLFVVLSVRFTTPSQPKTDNWTMFHHDPQHTGYSTSTAPNSNATIWIEEFGGRIFSSPAIVDETLYIGCEDHYFYAYDIPTGKPLWTFKTNGQIISSPAVYSNYLVFGSTDGTIYCLNKDSGVSIWNYSTNFPVRSSPIIIDYRVFVGNDNKYIFCLDLKNGVSIWKRELTDMIRASPAASTTKVFVGSSDGYVYCYRKNDGVFLWRYSVGASVYSSPAVFSDKVYISSYDGNLHCINENTGNMIWVKNIGNSSVSSPAIAYGKVFVGSNTGIYAFALEDGTFKWYSAIPGGVDSSPAVADRKVFGGTNQRMFYCFNETDGSILWGYATIGKVFSPAIQNNMVFVGSENKLYCFGVRPPYLRVALNLSSYTVKSGTVINVSVRILSSNTSIPISGALVRLNSSNGGSFVPQIGYSDKGYFYSNYTAPFVTAPTISKIIVTCSHPEYVEGSDFKLINILPLSKLQVKVKSNNSVIQPNHTTKVVVHVEDEDTGKSVPGANVTLSCTNNGRFNRTSGYTGADGNFPVDFKAPIVSSETVCNITAKVNKQGFINNTGYVNIIVRPELKISIYANSTIISENSTAKVTAHVFYEKPVAHSLVKFLAEPKGTVEPLTAYTDSMGYVSTIFKAPYIGTENQLVCIIYVTASHPKFINCTGSVEILVIKKDTHLLLVAVDIYPKEVFTGGSAKVTVYVTNSSSGLPVGEVTVRLNSSIGGSFTPSPFGTTNIRGIFKATFNTPILKIDTISFINVSADKPTYVTGYGQCIVKILSQQAKMLQVSMEAKPQKIFAHQTSNITITVTDGVYPVSDVEIELSVIGEGVCTDPVEVKVGTYISTFVPAIVISKTKCTIIANVSKSNYISNSSKCEIVVSRNKLPVCHIETPIGDSNVSGVINISGSANDPDGTIYCVEIKITFEDGKMFVNWTPVKGTISWYYRWDTTHIPNGKYIIYARAFDGIEYSQPVGVLITVYNPKPFTPKSLVLIGLVIIMMSIVVLITVRTRKRLKILRELGEPKFGVSKRINEKQLLPTCRIEKPSEQDVISGIYKIQGTASVIDLTIDSKIHKVEIKFDKSHQWIRAMGNEKWHYIWDTTLLPDGTHLIFARSFDGRNYSSVVRRTVVVDNRPPEDQQIT